MNLEDKSNSEIQQYMKQLEADFEAAKLQIHNASLKMESIEVDHAKARAELQKRGV